VEWLLWAGEGDARPCKSEASLINNRSAEGQQQQLGTCCVAPPSTVVPQLTSGRDRLDTVMGRGTSDTKFVTVFRVK